MQKWGEMRGKAIFLNLIRYLVHFRIQSEVTFLKVPKNSIRDSPYFIHFWKRQERGQNEEKRELKEGFDGTRPKEGAKRGGGAPS